MLIYLSMMDTPEAQDKFCILYEQYKNLMFYVANEILGDTRDSEDVVHQAFVKIIENLDKISEPKCPQTRAFVVTIVERQAIDLYRRRQNHSKVTFDDGLEWEPATFDAEASHLRGDLAAAMGALPVRYRQVLLLRYDSGYSEAEVAHMLSMSPANVRKTIQRARKKLAELLEREEAVKK